MGHAWQPSQVCTRVKKRRNTERKSLIANRIPQDGEEDDLEEVEELEGSSDGTFTEEAGQETGNGGGGAGGGAYLKPCAMCKARRKVHILKQKCTLYGDFE
jgi:hypothetical protein